jgi:hypothetical protein
MTQQKVRGHVLFIRMLSSEIVAASRRAAKSQVILRRLAQAKAHHTRAHISEDIIADKSPLCGDESEPSTSTATLSDPTVVRPSSSNDIPSDEARDELPRFRELLKPPPIPGVEDWAIPPASSEPCDPAIKVRNTQTNWE